MLLYELWQSKKTSNSEMYVEKTMCITKCFNIEILCKLFVCTELFANILRMSHNFNMRDYGLEEAIKKYK